MAIRMRTGVALVAAMLGWALAAGGAAQAQPKVLRVAPSADLTLLDPMQSAVIVTRLYSLMVYETLFAWDVNLQPKPQMVDTWSTAADGLSWRFALRPGLKFHDGSLVTSRDVAASLKRWMSRDALGQLVAARVTAIEPVEATTFEIKLSAPAPFLPWALGSGVGLIPAIMREADIVEAGTRPVTTAIGSGPFRFNHAARVSGSRVVFDRNADYQPRPEPADGLAGGRVVKVDQVEWRVMPDGNTAASALRTGEIDLIEAPLLDLVPLLRRGGGIAVRKINQLNNQGILRPNSLFPPFDDPKARRALALLAGQGDYMSAVAGDPANWRDCAAYYICGGPNGKVVGTMPKPDIAEAKRLLAEAGYKGEPLVVIGTKELAPIGQMTEVMLDALRQAGVKTDVVWTDWGTMATRQTSKKPPAEGGWNIVLTYSSGITAQSPLTNVGTNMSCEGRNWIGWPCDPRTEELRKGFLEAADEPSRMKVLQTLQERLEEVRPYVPLGEFEAPIAYRETIKGVLDSPVLVYWNIDKP